MKFGRRILVAVLFTTLVSAQEKVFPRLTDADIPNLKITREQSFDGSGLWGYINGGADIFLEYGFDMLLLQEVELSGNKYKVELYRMINPESAFGIFSVSHYKCERFSELVKFSCITQYQVQCAAGAYYISIINSNGSEIEQKTTEEIFNKVIQKIDAKKISFPVFFQNNKLAKSLADLKYFKGILGVQNGIGEWYDYFEKLNGYEIYFLPIKIGDKSVSASYIKFHSEVECKNFQKGFGIDPTKNYSVNSKNDMIRIIKKLSGNEIIFLEGNAKLEGMETLVQ